MKDQKVYTNDHDLLVRVDTKLDSLTTQFSNHLRHHFAVTLLALSSTLSLVVALLVFIFTQK